MSLSLGIGLGLTMQRGGASLYGTDFAFVMATTGAAETVTIPCQNVGTFNAEIDWGDDTTSTITTFDDADLAHEYADAGDHTIRISGAFPNIYFNNAGDKLKLKSVLQLGDVGWTRFDEAFYGCTNLTEFSVGVTDTSAVSKMASMFRSCTGLTTLDLSNFDTTANSDLALAFFGCSGLTTLDLSSFDTALVTSFSSTFFGCSSLTSLDVSSFDTTLVNIMTNAFRALGVLDIIGFEDFDLSGLDGTGDLNLIASDTTIPTARYDALLIKWSAQDPFDGMAPNFGSSKYTDGGAAAAGRAKLIATDLWTITDGGIA